MSTNNQKLFSTIDDQISILRDSKGICISDDEYAKDVLSRIGYFPLMGGYKHLFRIPLTKTYKPGTSFEEIVSLYKFDADLREHSSLGSCKCTDFREHIKNVPAITA